MTLDELFNSPPFRQALFDIQTRECERMLADMQKNEIPLDPGCGEHPDIEVQCDE